MLSRVAQGYLKNDPETSPIGQLHCSIIESGLIFCQFHRLVPFCQLLRALTFFVSLLSCSHQFTKGVEPGRVVQVIARLGEAVGEIGLAGGQVRLVNMVVLQERGYARLTNHDSFANCP